MCISIWNCLKKTSPGNSKILFVLGSYEYLKRLEGKIRKCLFSKLKYSKITVCYIFIRLSYIVKSIHSHLNWLFIFKYVFLFLFPHKCRKWTLILRHLNVSLTLLDLAELTLCTFLSRYWNGIWFDLVKAKILSLDSNL